MPGTITENEERLLEIVTEARSYLGDAFEIFDVLDPLDAELVTTVARAWDELGKAQTALERLARGMKPRPWVRERQTRERHKR